MQELPFQLAVKVCNADTEGKLANLPYAMYLSLRICKGLCSASSFHNVILQAAMRLTSGEALVTYRRVRHKSVALSLRYCSPQTGLIEANGLNPGYQIDVAGTDSVIRKNALIQAQQYNELSLISRDATQRQNCQ